MKALIWILCIFGAVLVRVLCQYSGITLGGIPTALLMGGMFWLCRTLTKVWDKKHQPKNEQTPVSVVSAINSQNGQKTYCRQCGAETKKEYLFCNHCGTSTSVSASAPPPSGRTLSIKAWAIVISIYLVFIIIASIAVPNGNRTVYITRTGDCYHRAGCSSLQYSKRAVSLESAVDRGYRSCNNCDPPELRSSDRDSELTLSSFFDWLLISVSLSLLVWYLTVGIFYFLDIPSDQIHWHWYFITAMLFVAFTRCI